MAKKLYDSKFIEKQKHALEKEKKRLDKELKVIDKFPSHDISEEENAMEVEQVEDNQALKKNIAKEFKQVDLALKKIDKNTYGTCEKCKGLIEKGRLEAYPAATLCVECSGKIK